MKYATLRYQSDRPSFAPACTAPGIIDFRNLNEVCKTEFSRVPRIDETIDSLNKSIIYSTIDLFSGYYQIEVAEPDVFKTCFTSEFGKYEFTRLPMGLAGSSATFIRVMEELVKGLESFVSIYADDLICHSASYEEHIIHLEKLFISLGEYGLKMKMSKCFFAQDEVEYLGHIVSRFGIKPNPAKINDIKCYPIPKKVQQIRRFLGMCGYFRRFVANFAETAHALTNVTRKGVPWTWGAEHQKAFETLRDNLVSYPTLGYPLFDRIFRITSDASAYAVGATLTQMQPSNIEGIEEEVERVICYTSKHLTESQMKWSVVERECYGIYHCTQVWNCYLYFREVHCFSDHRPLQWLNKTKPEFGRLFKWAQRLRTYDIKIFYKPGALNQAADALSRIGDRISWYNNNIQTVKINNVQTEKTENCPSLAEWKAAQDADLYCNQSRKKMEEFERRHQESRINKSMKTSRLRDGIKEEEIS